MNLPQLKSISKYLQHKFWTFMFCDLHSSMQYTATATTISKIATGCNLVKGKTIFVQHIILLDRSFKFLIASYEFNML